MALREDLLNELRNKKYYQEVDFAKLVQRDDFPDSYATRIERISESLKQIALTNSAIQLAEQFLPAQQPQQAPVQPSSTPVEEPDVVSGDQVAVEKEHKVQGQTHGE